MTDPKLAISTPYGRHYAHPRREKAAPSITNIKAKKDIPGLKFWAAREAATYAAEHHDRLTKLTLEERVQLIKSAPFGSASKNADSSHVGDVVHEWVDRYAKGEEIPEDEIANPTYAASDGSKRIKLPPAAARSAKGMWRQFFGAGRHKADYERGVVDRYPIEWIESEFTVWSDAHNYAGTADWAAKINGAVVLGDTKTGRSLYPDMRYQLAALANADFILDDDGNERPLPQFEKFAILHLRPTFARLVPVNPDAIGPAFQAFLGLAAVFQDDVAWEQNTFMRANKIEVRARGN